MKLSELLKVFRENKIEFVRHGKKHDIYHSPITGNEVQVPRHKKEIKPGTLETIKKDAGLK